MKKFVYSFIVLVIAIFSFSFNQINIEKNKKTTSEINFKEISIQKAIQVAAKENKLVFIYFQAKWCGPCKVMSSTTFKDKEVVSLYNKEFLNIKLDVDKKDVKQIAIDYEINSIPFFVILNSKGNVIKKDRGYFDASNLLAFAKDAIRINKEK